MSAEPKLTLLGRFVILLVLAGCGAGAYWAFKHQRAAAPVSAGAPREAAAAATGMDPVKSQPGVPVPAAVAPATVEVGIAYGTEKKRWLEWAVEEYGKLPAGQGVTVNLIPMGSLEAAQSIVAGDKRIHVWSPASSLYTANFAQEFELKHGRKPIEKEEQLALTPMVFVAWKERLDAFRQSRGELTFKSLATALKEKGGWDAIAGKPEWGFLKFAHTHPNQSNSGLMALVLMAYDFHDRTRGLRMADIVNASFQGWMIGLESAVTDMPNSTGNMMRDMVLKGPSAYDAILVYESVAIDYLKNAEGRWGQLTVVYPRMNLWSDNPYYVLNAPWSEKPQRRAAETFLKFLMSEPAQRMALNHGFRPGNPAVPILFPESPFTLHAKQGLKVELPSVCEAPSAEVIHNLLVGWNNNVRNR